MSLAFFMQYKSYMLNSLISSGHLFFFFFQAEDGIRDKLVTGVQTCALPICSVCALHQEVCMRRIFAELTLAVLTVACSEQATAPAKKMSAVARDFTNSSDGGTTVAQTVLCSNPSGSVFVRQQCLSNEQQLDPVALGLVGPQGPAGPPGPSGISGYQIVTHQAFLSPSTIANVHVECPIGKRVLG